jgi:hypothetical protein
MDCTKQNQNRRWECNHEDDVPQRMYDEVQVGLACMRKQAGRVARGVARVEIVWSFEGHDDD